LSGKKSRNSEYNCAASVLLWASTSVGFFAWAMTFDIVQVLPEPVTPNNV